MDFFECLEPIRGRWNVLAHPFYQRWQSGLLNRDELAFYAGEYRHAVVALARTAASATAIAGPSHAAEEQAHIALWDDFRAAFAPTTNGEPRPETAACVRAWTAAGDALEALAILYAVESGQPEISRTKVEGLVQHYGFAADSRATAYFTLHADRDHEHAEQSRRLLDEHASLADSDRLLAVAEAALRANWLLLDGTERHAAAAH